MFVNLTSFLNVALNDVRPEYLSVKFTHGGKWVLKCAWFDSNNAGTVNGYTGQCTWIFRQKKNSLNGETSGAYTWTWRYMNGLERICKLEKHFSNVYYKTKRVVFYFHVHIEKMWFQIADFSRSDSSTSYLIFEPCYIDLESTFVVLTSSQNL